jgi:hypothetical protein
MKTISAAQLAANGACLDSIAFKRKFGERTDITIKVARWLTRGDANWCARHLLNDQARRMYESEIEGPKRALESALQSPNATVRAKAQAWRVYNEAKARAFLRAYLEQKESRE